MKILNLHAGVGGNRAKWLGHDVTAVEYDSKIAAVYSKLYPDDVVIVGDANQYLLEHYEEYDMVWASPPCPTHSRMQKFTRHKIPRYPDMSLYQIIIFLTHFFKGYWVVENVKPYYIPLIPPSVVMDRHIFWCNFTLPIFHMDAPKNFINTSNLTGKKAMMDWLGIHFDEVLYVGTNHCPVQVLRNCVHPDLGNHILNAVPTK